VRAGGTARLQRTHVRPAAARAVERGVRRGSGCQIERIGHIHQILFGEQGRECALRAHQRGLGVLELGLVGAQLLLCARIVDAVAQPQSQARVGVVVVRTCGVAGPGGHLKLTVR
jgi:hypothetical protein